MTHPRPTPRTGPIGHSPAARRPRPTGAVVADAVASCLLWIAFVIVSLIAVYFSFFFAMAGDSCFSDTDCPEQHLISTGMFTVWAGVAATGLLVLIGTIVSICKRWYAFYWPLLGIPLVIVCVYVGVELANRGGGLG